MVKSGLALLSSLLITLGLANTAVATPADTLVQELANSVLRVQVKLADGKRGLGSAVVVAKDELVTNCHVVNGATDIVVFFHGEAHVAHATKSDWRHDLCMLNVAGLDAPVVHMGATKHLTHETAIFTVGYPGETKSPINTFGVVKGMFPMDGSMVMRASTPFNLGASGGGAFDDAGNLVGIITLKSKGNDAHYFYMPVEWVQSLMHTPIESLSVASKQPFWASSEQERPFFMRVVHPYQNKDWVNLLAIAKEWCSREPNTAESWFYLASAEFAKNDLVNAEAHFQQVLALDNSHLEASEYLSKITAKMANMKLASNLY
jgi:S1-C subfamily serine protease